MAFRTQRNRNSGSKFRNTITRLWNNLSNEDTSEFKIQLSPVEDLEDRVLLSAIFPAFVDGVFTFGDPNSEAPYGLENTFLLASNPNATKTIFLDFDGHHSVNNRWGHDIMFDPFSRDADVNNFSDAELIEIQKQFQNVAEDFFPFDVNVTTIDPGLDALLNTGNGDQEWGVRSLATQAKDGFGNGIGGVAYVGFFGSPGWDADAPAFTFNKGVNNGAQTHSHEVGHTLRLFHDGLGNQTYHPGVGNGATGWGPIMGAPFGKNLSQWSIGDYPNSTNTEDDLNIITTRPGNGFGYKLDDHGNDIGSASAMNQNGTDISAWGNIERNTDLDFFAFSTGEGNVIIDINPFQENPNLDIEAKIHNAAGDVVATSNPVNDVKATFDVNLASGDYYISIDGVGKSGVYSDYGSLGFYTIVGTVQEGGGGNPDYQVGETGIVDVNSGWTTVNLNGFYVDPVIVASLNTENDNDPATLRIRNVTNSSFQIQVDEWNYLDGPHPFETVSYMVMESGVHTLNNGLQITAGNVSTNHNWLNVNFNDSFDSTPIVMSQTVSRNGGATVVTRMDDVTTDGFRVKLQEEEAADGRHSFETISWIAFEQGVGTFSDVAFEADTLANVNHQDRMFNFNRTYSDNPAVFAAMQTYNGDNTASTRISETSTNSATLNIEEERSQDDEVGHIGENVGYFAIEVGNLIAETSFGEVGVVSSLTDQWRTVNLLQDYENPVVVAGLISLNDTDESTVRVRNITSSSFEIQVDEWDFNDRTHSPESVGYFVIEAGVHKFPDGTMIVANNDLINHKWKAINYGYNFDSDPVVVGQATSINGRSAVTTRLDAVGTSGFNIQLQEQESADGTHAWESISWFAVEQGSSAMAGYSFDSLLESGVTHLQKSIEFENVFDVTPVVFGNIQTLNENDTATVRETATGVSPTAVALFIEEEASLDFEKIHAPETIGVFAVERGRTSGVTVDFFSGPTTGVNPPSAWAQASSNGPVFVPRVTYVDNGPQISETWMPYAEHHHPDEHAHDLHDQPGASFSPSYSDAHQAQTANSATDDDSHHESWAPVNQIAAYDGPDSEAQSPTNGQSNQSSPVSHFERLDFNQDEQFEQKLAEIRARLESLMAQVI